MFIECHPIWEEITKGQYLAAAKKYAPKSYNLDLDVTTLEEFQAVWDEIAFYDWYKKEAIYPKGVGIIDQIRGTVKPIGYKYYKRIGTEPIIFHGERDIPLLKKMGLIK